MRFYSGQPRARASHDSQEIGLARWRGDLYVSQNSYLQGPVRRKGEIVRIRDRERH